MPVLSSSLFTLIAFVAALFALYILSRQVSLQLQTVVYFLTGSSDMAVLFLFLVLMPGIFVHEAAHWLMARLLGLKTGKFRVWPKTQGRTIGMGQVSVQQGGVWRDSLVGLAPLLIGSFLVTLIAGQIFQAGTVTTALNSGGVMDVISAFTNALRAPDGALWAYALFAVANAMMPSASDREPVKPLLLYLALAVAIYIVLDFPPDPFTSALNWLAPLLAQYVSALFFVIMLDLCILAVLYLGTLLFAGRRH